MNNGGYIYNIGGIWFDQTYGVEKIIIYDGGSAALNYSFGVNANTLFYSSPSYHKFYIGGSTTTALMTISSTGTTFSGFVSGISKLMVGLSDVNNTTDLLKPISTATLTALNLKAPLTSISNINNTSDLLKPISTATQTALNLKAQSPLTESIITAATQTINTTGLCYTFTLAPYYSDGINISCPIASRESGTYTTSPLVVYNTITTITCTINKNGFLFSNPAVTTSQNIPMTKITTMTGVGSGTFPFTYKQYFLNASTIFTPTYENATNTYTVTFTINGAGTFEFNTITPQTFIV
jgi:hypothetical protein